MAERKTEKAEQGSVRSMQALGEITSFLQEFDDADFPRPYSRWFCREDHDPWFTLRELRKMNGAGVIELQEGKEYRGGVRYRLISKATVIRDNLTPRAAGRATGFKFSK